MKTDLHESVASASAEPTAEVKKIDHWSAAALLERAASLHQPAREGDGSSGETLASYPRHCAMLSYRCGDGQAEVHENFADVFYVLEGSAALVTGGIVLEAAAIAHGEIRGASIEGGQRQELRPGDVAHVPAGLPHQMLVARGATVTCLVLKVREN
jgi:mannose-6-phosphate isomerase-like protein (cupin superfamily)